MNRHRSTIMIAVLAVVVTACGGGSIPSGSRLAAPDGTTTVPSTTEATDDLEASLIDWCAGQTAEGCRSVLQLVAFERSPEVLACLVAAPSIEAFRTGWCDDSEPPSTTIPTSLPTDVDQNTARGVEAYRAAEAWLRGILVAAHPDGRVHAGFVLREPDLLAPAIASIEQLGAEPYAVWRTEWVCFDPYAALGLTGWPKQAERFAYLDGNAEAARLRAAAEASGEPIVGRDFFEAQLALIELASEALYTPDVRVEVVLADAPLSMIETAERSDRVTAVRLLDAYDEGVWPGDLGEAPVPDC